MIDVQQVRELIELMVEHGLSEIRVREGETAINLRRGPAGEPVVQTVAVAPAPYAAPTAYPPPAPHAPLHDDALVPVTSPMVGTFYASQDPETPPFVNVGAEVDPDTTVCLIEAMKVFNEIKAEVAGTVERILVRNEPAGEYGQPIMLVRPRS